jgi:two-component system, NarL family, invasion response regulator UvrY
MSSTASNAAAGFGSIAPCHVAQRVLVVDDHPIVRDGLKQALARADGISVEGEAGSSDEALAAIRRAHWDLVILDVSLPGRSGLDLLRDLRRIRPGVPVLVLSVHTEEEIAVRAIRGGAAGYLRKDCATRELVEAVRVLLDGHKFISAAVAERLAEEIGREVSGPRHTRLSDRELEVVCLVATGKSTKQIASALSVGKSTVSTYRQRIFEKLEVRSNAEITRYALRHGLVS